MTKRIFTVIAAIFLLYFFSGCDASNESAPIVATTLPVYEFSTMLCAGTDLTVSLLVTENVSCLHDYALSVRQVKAVESAELILISGGGLEDFMADLLGGRSVVDSSAGIPLLEVCHDHSHEGHSHDHDPHIWLAPENAKVMANNICSGLTVQYPQYAELFAANLQTLTEKLDALQQYGKQLLSTLSCRELITFHDGFSYLAHAFDLTILAAVEEESGSEASAAELKELILLTREHGLPAVFTEKNSSASAADVIAAETGVSLYALDMAMSGNSYFDAMYHNLATLKEALK